MKRKLIAMLMGIAMLSASQAYAAGFALIEQSVSAMGTAYAGAGSLAEDASTVWFNPAGLTRLPCRQLVAGAHFLYIDTKFHNKGTTIAKDPPLNIPMPGNNGGNIGGPALVPNLYLAWQLDDCWTAGLGINSPFGLVTDYSGHWVGRYYADRSAIMTININPSIAYQVNDCLSVGAGFNAMYFHADFTNKINFGLIGCSLPPPAPTCPFGPPSSFDSDGRVKIKGNSWGFGGNIGVLYEPWCGTRLGLAFRSEVKQDIEGTEKFKDLPTSPVFGLVPGLADRFQNTKAKAKVTLPMSVILSGYHEIDCNWAIVADVMWTKWDVIKQLRFKFKNPAQPDGITTLKWDNAWRLSLGAIYTLDCNWKLRGGVAYDQAPTPNKKLRTPRLPEDDRYWVALGAGYEWNDCWHFDFGYAHLFVKDTSIDKSKFDLPEERLAGGLKGKYNSHTDILSAQVVWNF